MAWHSQLGHTHVCSSWTSQDISGGQGHSVIATKTKFIILSKHGQTQGHCLNRKYQTIVNRLLVAAVSDGYFFIFYQVTAVAMFHFSLLFFFSPYFLKRILFIFLDRGEAREKARKHQWVVASRASPTGDLACSSGLSPRLGIQPVTLWSAGQCSIHCVTPAKPFLFPPRWALLRCAIVDLPLLPKSS